MLRLRSDIPEVKERGVVQIERGDKWHQPGQSLNGVLRSRASKNNHYHRAVLLLVVFPLSSSPPDPHSEVPHPSQVVGARQCTQSVVVDGVAVENILRTKIINQKTL